MTLEEILQEFFGRKKPFLKRKRLCGHWMGGGEPEPDYEYLTRAGGKAYGKLVCLMYDLEKLLGDGFDANKWISILDEIVSEEG